MVDVQRKPCLVGELLQLGLPEPHARAVRAAAIRRDRQLMRIWIALASHPAKPAADRLDGELGRVAGDPDADESGIVARLCTECAKSSKATGRFH